jgi:RNA polymerase sigma-70 factor (ECF subfamily)
VKPAFSFLPQQPIGDGRYSPVRMLFCGNAFESNGTRRRSSHSRQLWNCVNTPVYGQVATLSPASPDLAAMVAQMRDGDESTLEEFYELTVSKVYAVAMAIVRHREDAEEVVCDTYLQAWNQAARFNAEQGTVLGWLTMMCRSRALDRLRQRRRYSAPLAEEGTEAVAAVADDAVSPEQLVALLQDGTRVRAAVAALSPQRQRFISLAFLQGLSHEEIATRTGTPLGTVKSHVRRALSELRAALG